MLFNRPNLSVSYFLLTLTVLMVPSKLNAEIAELIPVSAAGAGQLTYAQLSGNGRTVIGQRTVFGTNFRTGWITVVGESSSTFPVAPAKVSADGSRILAFKEGPFQRVIYDSNGSLITSIPAFANASDFSGNGTVVIGNGTSPGTLTPYHIFNVSSSTTTQVPGTAGYFAVTARVVSNDGAAIAGWLRNTDSAFSRYAGFYYSPGTGLLFMDPLASDPITQGALFLLPYDMSADGTTVVGNFNDGSAQRAAVWRLGEGLSFLSIGGGLAEFVSGDGSIVAGFDNGIGAFIWSELTGMLSVEDYILDRFSIDLGPAISWSVGGISDDGSTFLLSKTTSLAAGSSPQLYVVRTIPELSSVWLGGIALTIAFSTWIWRSKRNGLCKHTLMVGWPEAIAGPGLPQTRKCDDQRIRFF